MKLEVALILELLSMNRESINNCQLIIIYLYTYIAQLLFPINTLVYTQLSSVPCNQMNERTRIGLNEQENWCDTDFHFKKQMMGGEKIESVGWECL